MGLEIGRETAAPGEHRQVINVHSGITRVLAMHRIKQVGEWMDSRTPKSLVEKRRALYCKKEKMHSTQQHTVG